jgi:hypothetical protein
MVNSSKLILIFTSILSISLNSNAGDLKLSGNNDIVWQAGINGIEIEWDQNGAFKRVYSQKCNPVRIPDREGITKASDIAEEYAKGAIVSFIEQNSFGSKLVNQISSDSERATRNQTAGSDVVNTETSRQMSETLTRIVGSDFKGKLSGVVLLESGYDPKRQEACVRVGISLKTLGAANSLSNALSNKNNLNNQNSKNPSDSKSNLIQESETRKSRMEDW